MNKQTIRSICFTGIFTALLVVCSQLAIPIGVVPINLAVFAVFLCGTLLTPKNAFLSCTAYLLLGAVGLPVFAGFSGGFSVLVGATGGYLAAYPLMALLCSLKPFRRNLFFRFLGMMLSLTVCYILGTAWFMFVTHTPLMQSLWACVFPFVIPDIAKAACAVWLSKRLSSLFSLTIYN